MSNEKLERRLKREEKFIPQIIPAYKIVEQVQGSGFIQDYVNEILPVIADDIQAAIDSPEKKNHSITEIQTVFDVPGMDNKRAQMYVYFHLVRALKKSEYFPKIKFSGTRTNPRVYIYVKWFSSEDIEMEKYMNDFIQAHSFGGQETDDSEKAKPVRRRRRHVK